MARLLCVSRSTAHEPVRASIGPNLNSLNQLRKWTRALRVALSPGALADVSGLEKSDHLAINVSWPNKLSASVGDS